MAKNEQYFQKFPTIEYRGVAVTDISRRVKLGNNVRNVPTAFYPWQLDHETRADVLAHQYYDDSSLHWLIHITNGIVDPYYGWFLTAEQLDAHIINKYGSLEDAKRRISHWAVNWALSDTSVSVGYYTSNLPEPLKKYFVPNYGPGTRILSYARRSEDWIVSTNRIYKLYVAAASTVWAAGDLVNSLDSAGGNVLGSCEVVAAETDHLLVKDVIDGEWLSGDHIGSRDGAKAAVLTADYDSIYQAISDQEGAYWGPVSYYDYEIEQNAKNSTVILLDRNYVTDVGETLALKLRSEIV